MPRPISSLLSAFRRKPADPRRTLFLTLIRDEDSLGFFTTADDDVLVDFARDLVVAAYEGRYESVKASASQYYFPGEAIDLACAAGLVAYAPTVAAELLARPNEASMRELRTFLDAQGFRITQDTTR